MDLCMINSLQLSETKLIISRIESQQQQQQQQHHPELLRNNEDTDKQ